MSGSVPRQNKGPRKDGPPGPSPSRGRGSGVAWRGHNPSIMQNFSPRSTPPQMLSPQSTNDSLAPSSPAPSNGNLTTTTDAPINGAPATLPPLNLNGSTIVVTTKSGGRYEGTLSSNDQSQPGISLRDAKDLVNPNAQVIPTYFIPAPQIANWRRPDPTPSVALNGNKVMQNAFATDKDISGASASNRERELQPWSPDGALGNGDGGLRGDATTFGSGAAGAQWDQFAVNETLFGVTTDYKEEIYTTRLDRKTLDYKDRERKAQIIADEISSGVTSNPHLREERGQADETLNEEDKYGAVVRGPGAYVPPGARKDSGPSATRSPPPVVSSMAIPKVSVNAPPNGESITTNGVKANGTGEDDASASGSKQHEDPGVIASFRDFVSSEKQKLVQKRQAIAKSEKEKRLASLVEFSQTFKLSKPVPEDLVPILAKDQQKQQEIIQKSQRDAEDRKARAIGMAIPPASGALAVGGSQAASTTSTNKIGNRSSGIAQIPPFRGGSGAGSGSGDGIAQIPPFKGGDAAKAAAAKPAGSTTTKSAVTQPKRPLVAMHIPAIPPFDPSKRKAQSNNPSEPNATVNGSTSAATPSPSSATPGSKMNVNAMPFRPNPNASAFKPGSSAASSSAKPTPEITTTPNPYFGVRPINKADVRHVKDDFNPFKGNKLPDPRSIRQDWPFSGKSYFPPSAQPARGPPQGPVPQSYEEDPAAQAAQARMAQQQQVPMYPNPYQPYPGGPPQMMGPQNGVPPAGYNMPYYMHPSYPQVMPPGPMYGMQPMPGMPPNQPYMAQPPQPQYPQNGGPRGPGTPMHHPYANAYHQSPQTGHQHLPYPMMMPPQQGGPVPPLGYDGQPVVPGPMGAGH